MMQDNGLLSTHSSHWGVFSARLSADGTLDVIPRKEDPAPSPILGNFEDALKHKARITRPMIRRGWLENGPGPTNDRGADQFVAVPWDEALDIIAGELGRIKTKFGLTSIFGGSYGWASAGRFHHAQSQIHRFLNTALGGYVRSVNSYSAGAAQVILPHVLGAAEAESRHAVTWDQIVEHTDLVLAFGGMAIKNSDVASGGVSQHIEKGAMQRAASRGCRFVSLSPLRTDLPAEAQALWLPIRPNTDTALMLAMMYALDAEGLADRHFLATHCAGFDMLAAYIRGLSDGVPKTPQWAQVITGISADTITALARQAVSGRTLITVAHALQRAEHGEQPVWAGVALAAMIGQLGLPGGGFSYALGAMAHTGRSPNAVPSPVFPQGRNNVEAFIPVARIADMLLQPGQSFDYNGRRLTYPDIKLIYWAGGNLFHHHQDINRLRKAIVRPDTFIVHESAWTATARHADIVLPITMSLEREDIGAALTDPLLVAMRPVAKPIGDARNDYDIFCELSRRLGVEARFTEDRDADAWMDFMLEPARDSLTAMGLDAPDLETLRARGEWPLPSRPDDGGGMRLFRQDPERHGLGTPSGLIEVGSEAIAAFGYEDCPGHPAWLEPEERPTDEAPLWLVANQPATRLHSQLDFGAYSQSCKVKGREVVRIHPRDAAARAIGNGDVVKLYNARGACLAAAQVTDAVMPGVVNLPTGAWYDPFVHDGETVCAHGNPNMLTRDKGTSSLAQGCTGQLCCVQCERWDGPLPPIRAYEAPEPVAAYQSRKPTGP